MGYMHRELLDFCENLIIENKGDVFVLRDLKRIRSRLRSFVSRGDFDLSYTNVLLLSEVAYRLYKICGDLPDGVRGMFYLCERNYWINLYMREVVL